MINHPMFFAHSNYKRTILDLIVKQDLQNYTNTLKKWRREGDLNSRSLARTRFMVKQFPGARPTRLGDPGTSLATNVFCKM